MRESPPILATGCTLGRWPAAQRWVDLEQTVNERLHNRKVFASIGDETNGVHRRYRASERASWRLSVCWVPEELTRRLGPLDTEVEARLGWPTRPGFVPIPIHPQGRALFREVIDRFGLEQTELVVTPTASERSLVAFGAAETSPCVVKVSLAVAIGRRVRAVRERDIARALLVSRVLDAIPAEDRAAIGLETFAERAGAVVDATRLDKRGAPARTFGWMLRALPSGLVGPDARDLMPIFSMVSGRGDRPSFLVDAVRRSGDDPMAFVIERVLTPYVQALAHVLFAFGVVTEPHAQNVSLGVDADGDLDGRVVLRDFTDASVHLGVRLARGLPLPDLEEIPFGSDTPFSVADEAVRPLAHLLERQRSRAALSIVRYGMHGVVWSLHHALAGAYPSLDRKRLYRAYLELWQRAAAHYLGFVPSIVGTAKLAVDEALLAFARATNWGARGAGARRSWPAAGLPLRWSEHRRRRGDRYREVDCAWGSLGIAEDGTPVYFRPRR